MNELLNPPWAEPPDENWDKGERLFNNQWGFSLFFHTFQGIAIWCLFGVLPFLLGVPWTMTYLFWLQLVPWVIVGRRLSRKFLSNMTWHFFVTQNELAALKLKSLLLWVVIFPYYAMVFWVSAVL